MAKQEQVVISLQQVKAHMKEVRKREKLIFGQTPNPVSERVALMQSRMNLEELNAIGRQVQGASTLTEAFDAAYEMAKYVANATSEIVACQKGCSHCCNIPVTISSQEAEIMSARTGKRLSQPKPDRAPYAQALMDEKAMQDFQRITQKRYVGEPCTFKSLLGDCSIYEHRPLACRLQLSVDTDDLLCKLVPNETPRVPYVDVRQIELMVLIRTLADPAHSGIARIADIREWFPRP